MPKITKSEEDVFILLKESLTPKQIAEKLHISRQRVYKIIKQLKRKNYIDAVRNPIKDLKGFSKIKEWRYHDLHFVIKPYYFFNKYYKIIKNIGNYGIKIREWIIKLHPTTIEIQLKKGCDFSSPDKWEATRKAETSFNRVLNEVSQRYGFLVWKEGKANIRLVNQELARNPSEVANARDGKYLSIKGIDGKVWFKIDRSKGAEHEYSHPSRTLGDSEIIEPYFNDMLYNQPPTITQLTNILTELIKTNKETAQGLNAVTKILQLQFKQPITQRETNNIKPTYIG